MFISHTLACKKFNSLHTASAYNMPTHHHSHALKEAIIAHWQNGLPYSKIVKKINDSGIAKINKSSVWYQIIKFKETDSTKNKPRSGRPRTVRTPE